MRLVERLFGPRLTPSQRARQALASQYLSDRARSIANSWLAGFARPLDEGHTSVEDRIPVSAYLDRNVHDAGWAWVEGQYHVTRPEILGIFDSDFRSAADAVANVTGYRHNLMEHAWTYNAFADSTGRHIMTGCRKVFILRLFR